MKLSQFIIVFFLLAVASLDAQALKCAVHAKSAILYNPDNGAILFEKHSHEPHYPASIIKIATAAFVFDQKKLDLQTECPVSKKAVEVINASIKQANPLSYPAYILEHDGVVLGLKEGKSYSLETLLHGMLLVSANDAANVIAEKCSGTVEKFMEELNEYLEKKGLRQTRLQNPHGLYHPAQITTAYDMALVAGLAFQNPLFLKMIKSVSFEDKKEIQRAIVNTNRLVKEGKYHYPKILGGKTGYTASSGNNLVAAAEDQGRKLIVVLLGCSSSEDRFKDAITLFETAFREKAQERLLFSKDHEHFSRKVEGEESVLKACLKEDVSLKYFASEECPLKAELVWYELPLPITSGDEVGKLVIANDKGYALTSAPLLAENSIDKQKPGLKKWLLAALILCALLYQLKKRSKIFKT